MPVSSYARAMVLLVPNLFIKLYTPSMAPSPDVRGVAPNPINSNVKRDERVRKSIGSRFLVGPSSFEFRWPYAALYDPV